MWKGFSLSVLPGNSPISREAKAGSQGRESRQEVKAGSLGRNLET